MLNSLIDEDKPDVGDDGIDAPPMVITAFSDDEPEPDDNIDIEW